MRKLLVVALVGCGSKTALDALPDVSPGAKQAWEGAWVLVLRHDGFWTLHGHLDPESIAHWAPGDVVAAGDPIARLGAEAVNGGWPPHLHLQLFTALPGRSQKYQARGIEQLIVADDAPEVRAIAVGHLLIQQRVARSTLGSGAPLAGEIEIPLTGKTLREVEREAVQLTLRATDGNQSKAGSLDEAA